jgi:CheY-like chemotaxis protein/HPt (histidine-containing phosphotransfer) domain-containing protein
MGGTIRLDSQVGRGSNFSFDLVLPRAATSLAEDVTAVVSNLGGRRVLLAEDHPLSQEILLEMLEDLGCDADVASDGAEAVEKARALPYDLVLMDVQMPRMNGLEATRAIRTLPGYRDTPIVGLTAYAFAEDRLRCLEAGMSGYLTKPLNSRTLAATLGQLLPLPVLCEADRYNRLQRALMAIPEIDATHILEKRPEQLADYCSLLDRFVKQHAADMNRLRELLAADDNKAARVVAHNLTGIAGMVGAVKIASLAREIVQGLRAGADEPSILLLAAQCEMELATLAEAVRTLPLAEMPSPGDRGRAIFLAAALAGRARSQTPASQGC